MKSYQRNLGLVFATAALLVLFVSSAAQPSLSYAQFAYAYSQTTQKCINFPTPLQIVGQFLIGGSAPLFKNDTSSKWHQQHAYIKSFNLRGLGLNETSISFASLDMKVFLTSEWFYNDTAGHIQKSSSTNTTYIISLNNLAVHVATHEAHITVKEAHGSFTSVSREHLPTTLNLSVENVKATITCGASS